MARSSVQLNLPPSPVNMVRGADQDEPEAVNKVHDARLDVPLVMAKGRTGKAIRQAIEGRSLKEFGAKSLMSEVCSGEKVPDYLARIVEDKRTRRRFALALLEDDTDVVVTTTITIPQSKKVG